MDFLIENELKPTYTKDNIYLYNMDCLKIMEKMKNNCIDCIVTDPPYKLTKRGYGKPKEGKKYCGGMLSVYNNTDNTEYIKEGKLFKYNEITFNEWMPELYRVIKEGGHCYLMTNYRNYDQMLEIAKSVGFIHTNTIIWIKGNYTPSNNSYMNGYEMILQLRKGKCVPINFLGDKNIITDIPNIMGKINHPTEKPVELFSKLILQSSKENEIVFDPFAGAGSCALSCIENNRKCICCEIDEKYYNKTIERLENK